MRIQGHNSAATLVTYGKTAARILDPTAAAESGELLLVTRKNGALQNAVTIGQGVRVGSPTGGDKGSGTLNATEFWENGKRLDGQGVARAWVVFNGQNLTIHDSFNVASIDHIGTGDWTINFITPQPHTGFGAVVSVNSLGRNPTPSLSVKTPTSINIRGREIVDTNAGTGNTMPADFTDITVAVFGDIP